MTPATAAASPTVGAMTPTAMIVKAVGGTPVRAVRPTVGRSAATPHSAAGTRTLPPPSMPRAKAATPAATAAAEPEEEPPAWRAGSCGLRGVPQCGLRPVMPTPTSWQLALPSRMAPAARRAATQGASPATGRTEARKDVPAVVGWPTASTASMRA
jgi:hypothetical protein